MNTSPHVAITAPGDSIYNQYIESYWSWLLGPKSNVPVQEVSGRRVLFMRTIYEYAERWNPPLIIGNPPRRENEDGEYGGGFSNDGPIPLSLKSNQIFLPVIDTCVSNLDLNAHGHSLTPQEKRDILDEENKAALSHSPSATATVKKSTDPDPLPLVANLNNFMLPVPVGTFTVNIPCDSILASKMEFSFPKNQEVDLVVKGIYLIFTITTPGLYEIRSSAFGLRDYKAHMKYYVDVS